MIPEITDIYERSRLLPADCHWHWSSPILFTLTLRSSYPPQPDLSAKIFSSQLLGVLNSNTGHLHDYADFLQVSIWAHIVAVQQSNYNDFIYDSPGLFDIFWYISLVGIWLVKPNTSKSFKQLLRCLNFFNSDLVVKKWQFPYFT